MKLSYLLFLLLICISCVRPKSPMDTDTFLPGTFTEGSFVYYPIKDNRIPVDLDNPQPASLFDYFNRIELIPLETNDDVLIGKLDKVIVHQNRYYILDGQQFAVYVFDEEGIFVSKIDRKGRGPGEYLRLDNMIINPFTGNIDLLETSGRIHSYDLSGNHIKTVWVTDQTADVELRAIHELIVLNEKIYVIFSWRHPLKINYFDTDVNKIIHQEYEESAFGESLGATNNFYEYHGKWYFYRPFSAETYELGLDSLVKAYTWDFEKNSYDANKIALTEDMRKYREVLLEEYRRLPYIIRYQGQNNRYVMTLNRIDYNKYTCLMYDKSTQECKYIEQFAEQVEFLPLVVTNEYVLSYCAHGYLKRFITEEMLDEINRKKFDDLMNAEEEMNPILIKYYFK